MSQTQDPAWLTEPHQWRDTSPAALYESPRAKSRTWLHATLLGLTLGSTLIVGAQLQDSFARGLPLLSLDRDLFPLGWIWQRPSRLLLGLPFSCTLLAILLAHELGHYFTCRAYGIDVSLPYFIPAPTFIGTFGAFIRIRSRIYSRAALFDIGVSGPIAGFAVAVPALALGLALSIVSPELARVSDLQLGFPLIFRILAPALVLKSGHAIALAGIYLHPVAIAAWVGMFATALNLLPGGQLDGGHILYALWPRAHKIISWMLAALLLLMSPFLWAGWLIWAGVLLSFGRKHPPVPWAPGLGHSRRWLAGAALLIFSLTFTPVPFPGLAMDFKDFLAYAHSWVHRI
jgi:membrane-associated protease RseP (regulator of RpoE activity)